MSFLNLLGLHLKGAVNSQKWFNRRHVRLRFVNYNLIEVWMLKHLERFFFFFKLQLLFQKIHSILQQKVC